MKLEILYFAGVRDLLGKAREELELPGEVATVSHLAVHLVRRHPELEARLPTVRFAVNETFAAAEARLADGDVVALIPPVSGG